MMNLILAFSFVVCLVSNFEDSSYLSSDIERCYLTSHEDYLSCLNADHQLECLLRNEIELLQLQLFRYTPITCYVTIFVPLFLPPLSPASQPTLSSHCTMTSNSTVHISFGNAANHITSHLLNLQGLAATRGASASGGNGEKSYNESLCDPEVTHDISPIESDVYASATASASGRYMYVPRALIIDGRDSFGTDWGSSGSSGSVSSSSAAAAAQHSAAASWNGEVSLFDISNHDAILAGGQPQQQRSVEQSASTVVDPLDNFHRASAVIGLSPQFSRFNADPPTSYNSGISNNNNSRHVQWDDYDEEQEDEEDDDY